LQSDRPNFLVITTDQQRWDHVGYAGNNQIRTPNIDQLAEKGSWFSNFYVASPTCMSNRATLMTGRMPSLNGVRYNGVPLDLDTVTFVDLLRAAGYRTHLIGKCHLQGMESEPSHAPREVFPPELLPPPVDLSEARRSNHSLGRYRCEVQQLWRAARGCAQETPLPYYGFDAVDFCLGHADKVTGHYEAWLRETAPEMADRYGAGYAIEKGSTGVDQVYKPVLPEELYSTSYIKEKTISQLDEFSKNPKEPFFIHCSFPDPHHPFTPPGHYWDMYDPSEILLPTGFSVSSSNLIPPEEVMRGYYRNQQKIERWTFPYVATDDQTREIIARTYGQITMIDDAIGSIMQHLNKGKFSENTIVCFLSDHGDYLGQHGLMGKGPIHYQSIIRTPFVWLDYKQSYNRGRVDTLASTLDIAKTILLRAGLQPYNGIQGTNLLLPLEGNKPEFRCGLLIEQTTQYPYLGFQDLITISTIVNEKWRLSAWSGQGWGELYRIDDDPGEINNLWNSSVHSAIKLKLLIDLIQLIQSHRETSPYPLSVS